MAAIDPVPSRVVSGCEVWAWEGVSDSDTFVRVLPAGTEPVIGSFQVTGSFGGGTVRLQGSNNNSDWVNLNDISGDQISLTGAGAAEFSTAMAYLRPIVSGGTGYSLNVYISLRG
jgi:hypothetical protein